MYASGTLVVASLLIISGLLLIALHSVLPSYALKIYESFSLEKRCHFWNPINQGDS